MPAKLCAECFHCASDTYDCLRLYSLDSPMYWPKRDCVFERSDLVAKGRCGSKAKYFVRKGSVKAKKIQAERDAFDWDAWNEGMK